MRTYAKTQHTRARKPLSAKKIAKKLAKKKEKKLAKTMNEANTEATKVNSEPPSRARSEPGRGRKDSGARPYERGAQRQPFVTHRDRELLKKMGGKVGDFKQDKPWIVYTDEVS